MNTNLFLILWLNESRDAKIYSVADAGEGPGGGLPPLFLDQTEAWRAEKTFWRPPPPFSNGVDDRQPRSVQGLDPALLN